MPSFPQRQVATSVDSIVQALHLDSEADRDAFRRWFTFLAEAQYFTPPEQRPREIVDCAALVRYAYREALRHHDSAWAAHSTLPLIPAIPSVAKYSYPRTVVGPRIFRTGPGTFAEFADARTLYTFNAALVGRDLRLAQPGDVLFYRRPNASSPFHTMVVIGKSQITGEAGPFVVYDTGPEGTQDGQIRRLSFRELLQFPDPQWHPVPENSLFLGVFRWYILRTSPS
jgi:uncharacterized protein